MARSPTPTTRRDVTRRPSVGIVLPTLSENIAKTTAARRRNATSMAYERPRTPATVGKGLEPYGMIVVRVHWPLWNRSVAIVVHENALTSCVLPVKTPRDQTGSARESRARRIARPRAKRDGPRPQTRRAHARKGGRRIDPASKQVDKKGPT